MRAKVSLCQHPTRRSRCWGAYPDIRLHTMTCWARCWEGTICKVFYDVVLTSHLPAVPFHPLNKLLLLRCSRPTRRALKRGISDKSGMNMTGHPVCFTRDEQAWMMRGALHTPSPYTLMVVSKALYIVYVNRCHVPADLVVSSAASARLALRSRVGYAQTASAGSQPSFCTRRFCRRTSLLIAPVLCLCVSRLSSQLGLALPRS